MPLQTGSNHRPVVACLTEQGTNQDVRIYDDLFHKSMIAYKLSLLSILQPGGAQAKPYQVKQVRHVILKYKLGGGSGD